MSRMKDIERNLKSYYDENLQSYGLNAKGVGWKSDDAQRVRFDQLFRIITDRNNFSINDLGCGLGDLYQYLADKNVGNFKYTGYDMLEEMLSHARMKYGSFVNARFVKCQGAHDLEMADYTVASGIFNLKYEMKTSKWMDYILDSLKHIDANSSKGFAFNMLTKYSDKELMKDELYYSDPLYFFDHCKRKFSRNVALLHDYNEYDFTILVRK